MTAHCMPYMELKSCYIPYIDTVHITWSFTMERYCVWFCEMIRVLLMLFYHVLSLCTVVFHLDTVYSTVTYVVNHI